MENPMLHAPYAVNADTHVLPGSMPVPGMGVLAVNAFLIRGRQPVLVDTGLAALADDFMAHLERLLDPGDLRFIWLTHTDPDHVGALQAVLERAPAARVVTTYLGMGKLGMIAPLPPERVVLLNPGQSLDLGDRVLHALRPPTYDAPETTGCYDARTGALFSADCFGAVVDRPYARAEDIPPETLQEGLVTWTTVDAPWLHGTATDVLDDRLAGVCQLSPELVLSAHLPPATGPVQTLVAHLRAAHRADPFVGPDQAQLERMLHAAGATPNESDEAPDCSPCANLA